jgi:hypothetical protein
MNDLNLMLQLFTKRMRHSAVVALLTLEDAKKIVGRRFEQTPNGNLRGSSGVLYR